MAQGEVERRLAAILVADVVGYSRLVGADEEGTIARLKALREELIDPSISKHHGRIVKTTGDGLLVEFASVVDAVRNASEVQRAMAEHNADVPESERIVFRVGVNLGDVVIEGDDILGDGVNVAARLEGLAEPGGICISGTTFDQVRDKLEVGYEYLGEQEVKNIARSVRVYRVLMEPERAGEVVGVAKHGSSSRMRAAAAAALLIVVAGGGTWWWQAQPDFEPADPAKMAYALPEKPSIAVLPFDNMSGDPDQDYIGDGLTENIIAMLSTSPDLFVIARNSSFTYKGKAVRVQEVAEQLGVRYVLEGSVQRADERLRITAQLVDAINGRHLWAERYDRELKDLKDLFALQDDITLRILVAMDVELKGETTRRVWESSGDLETYRGLQQARTDFQTYSPEGHLKTERFLTEALEKHPEISGLITFMGWVHWQKVVLGLSKDPTKDMAVAREFAENSLSIDEKDYLGHSLLATLDLYARNHESAIAHADRAIELAPTSATAVGAAGWVKSWSGQPREAEALLKRAMRLEPYHREWIPNFLSLNHFMLGQYDEAIAIAEALLASPSDDRNIHPTSLRRLAAISAIKGDMDRSRQYVERLLAIDPKASVSSLRRKRYNWKDQAFLERYLDALRKAGLPE